MIKADNLVYNELESENTKEWNWNWKTICVFVVGLKFRDYITYYTNCTTTIQM